MSTPSEQKRSLWLLRIFVVLFIVTGIVFQRDANLRASLPFPTFGRQPQTLNDILHPQEQEKRDPELGTTLPQNTIGASIRAVVRPGKSGYLLVFVGDCTACIKVDFPVWAKKAREHNVQIVGLTQARRERILELQSQLSELNVQMPIISDPNNEVISVLNSYYTGRAYLFSPTWRLEWMAHSLNSESSFWGHKAFQTALENGRQSK